MTLESWAPGNEAYPVRRRADGKGLPEQYLAGGLSYWHVRFGGGPSEKARRTAGPRWRPTQFIGHGRRELVHVNVTANPTAAWVWRQVIEATPWGQKARHLLRDRDAVYGREFRQRARRIGIDAIATPVRSPGANAIVERVIGTLRRECLDHMIVFDEQHLRSVLSEFVRYYNEERPHRTLGLQTPEVRLRPSTGPIRSRPVLKGLHHIYERAAYPRLR